MTSRTGDAPRSASSQFSPEEAADRFLQRLPHTCRLLVAFSGGGDSTGLLAALAAACRPRPDITLHAATVDHGLRAGSAEEARGAARVADMLGVPHSILKWTGEKPVTGIQAAARMARYALLVEEARRIGADLIVTGHTSDDQLETLAMRRARDPEARSAMDEAVLVARRVWVARPFLLVSRASIRDYLSARGIGWSDDPSNDNPAFERVRVRQSGLLAEMNLPPVDRTPYRKAARLVADSVRVHPGPVAAIALDHLDLGTAPAAILLSTLIAVLGGRAHGPGALDMKRLTAKLASGGDFRHSIGRVVVDRRRKTLYLCREERGLPDLTVAPGQIAAWDNRYEIANRGSAPARIAAGREFAGFAPLVEPGPWGALPKGIARRASASVPRLIEGESSALRVRHMLAPYEEFLTYGRLELAQSIAMSFGLEHFPSPPLGSGSI
jgi:tRNA(Ile)-lysidine synthase